jgi:YD repeat-containing protein
MVLCNEIAEDPYKHKEPSGTQFQFRGFPRATTPSSIRCLSALAAIAYAGVAVAETQSARGIWQWPWGGGYFFSVAEVCAADAALPAWSYWVGVSCHSVVQGETTGTYKIHACNPENPSACSDTPRTSAFTYACPPGENWTLSGTGPEAICTRDDAKDNGPAFPSTCNPIAIGSGNKWLNEVDLPVTSTFRFVRSYNSNSGTLSSAVGKNWRITYSQFLGLGFTNAVWLYRPDGKSLKFLVSGSTYTADADITDRLYQETDAGGVLIGYRVETADRYTERYNLKGKLISIANASGQTQTISYDPQNRLSAVTDHAGRQMTFTYNASNRISTLVDPSGGVTTYGYDANANLTSVTYPDATVRQYHYENATFKNALTGITDERGVRYITYSYNSNGKAASEVKAGGVGSYGFAFGTNQTTVTDPLGAVRTYDFQAVLGVMKNTGVSQPGGSGCGPAAEALTYDANGNVSSRTDFNGKKTTYVYDLTRNLETSRTEGLASSGAALPETRTITTSWHATWRLPVQVNEYAGASASGNPLRRTSTAYDDRGNVTSRSVTDVAAGLTRTWTTSYTYSTAVPGLILQKVEDGPRTDVTDTTVTEYYPHDEVCAGAALGTGRDKGCRGQVKRITNPLGQVTQFTRYNAHGQVEEITDPNGVVTTLTYDLRQRLISRSTAGETTAFQYDPVGQLTRLTQPDGSYINYSYDAARRLTEVADNQGNRIAYTLDAAGNRTKEEVFDPQGALAKTLTRAYDALGRMQTLTGVGND